MVRYASLAFVAAVRAATASHVAQLWRAMREDAEADRATYARILSKEINRNLSVIRAQMEAVDQPILEALGSGDTAGAEALLAQETRENSLVRELAVVAPDGRVLASSNPSHTGLPLPGYDFLSAPRDGQLKIGRPKEGRLFAADRPPGRAPSSPVRASSPSPARRLPDPGPRCSSRSSAPTAS